MRKLSHWASLHRPTAVALIVAIDVVKALAGICLGYRFFPALPGLIFELLVIGIIMAVLLIETQYKRQTAIPFLTKTDAIRSGHVVRSVCLWEVSCWPFW